MNEDMQKFKEEVYAEFLGYLDGSDGQTRSIAAMLRHELEQMTRSLERRKAVLAALAEADSPGHPTLSMKREVFDKWGVLGEFWRFERGYAVRALAAMARVLASVAPDAN